MERYATLEKYNIDYDTFSQKFYISSKNDGRPQIGAFDKAADAIDFAEKRIIAEASKL